MRWYNLYRYDGSPYFKNNTGASRAFRIPKGSKNDQKSYLRARDTGRLRVGLRQMARHRRKISRKPGLPPGTLAPEGIAGKTPVRITVLDYDAARFLEKELPLIEEIIPFRDTDSVTWINIDGLENTAVIEKVGRIFDIHPLILEDILNTSQRPKMEDLDRYLYVHLKMLQYREEDGEIGIEHVSMLVGTRFLISFQEKSGDVLEPVRDRIRKNGRIRKFGPDYLAYAIIDVIVDNYFLVMEHLEEKVETLEEELVQNAGPESLERLNRLKKDLIYLRKSVWPLREVISGIERIEPPLVEQSTSIYLKDVYDHVIQVIDTLEILRDMASGMIDIYLSGLSYRGNEIMKVLTLIATIFIPLTFVVGVYGMNFHNMPELRWEYGYLSVWAVMIVIVTVMVGYFKKRNWI